MTGTIKLPKEPDWQQGFADGSNGEALKKPESWVYFAGWNTGILVFRENMRGKGACHVAA